MEEVAGHRSAARCARLVRHRARHRTRAEGIQQRPALRAPRVLRQEVRTLPRDQRLLS